MKWLKCLENIATNNNPGMCPFCSSENTSYNATRITDDYGFLVVWCDDCLKAFSVSRMKIDKNIITDREIPKNLIFSC